MKTRIKESDLLPCPFCGQPVKIEDREERPEETLGYGREIRIACANKGCHVKPHTDWVRLYDWSSEKGYTEHPSIQEELVLGWNIRL